MVDKIKKRLDLAIIAVISLVLGLYFIIADASDIKTTVFVIVGIALILLSAIKIYSFKDNLTKENVIMPVITIAVGILLIFFGNIVSWLFIIAGIYILIEPCINIYRSKNRQGQLSLELPKILLGALLILLAFDALYAIVFTIAGVLAVIIAIYLAYCIINEQELIVTINTNVFKNNKKKTRDEDDIIDVE